MPLFFELLGEFSISETLAKIRSSESVIPAKAGIHCFIFSQLPVIPPKAGVRCFIRGRGRIPDFGGVTENVALLWINFK
jgi:hypothetical protein